MMLNLSKREVIFDASITSLLIILAFLCYRFSFLDMDVAWHVEGARRLLSGGSYLTNVFDDNAPHVFAYYFPIIGLLKNFPFNAVSIVILYNLTLTTLSLAVSYYLLNKYWIQLAIKVRQFIYYTLVYCLLFLPLITFGQREIILINFLVPYLLFVIANTYTFFKHSNNKIYYSLALIASFGIMQNIIYFFAMLIFDCYLLFKLKKIQRGQLFFYLSIIFQCCLTAWFFPEYIKKIIPLVLCYEQGFNESFLTVTLSTYSILCLLAILLYLFDSRVFTCLSLWKLNDNKIMPSKNNFLMHCSDAFLVLLLGCWLIYLFEKKIWYSHLYPGLVFALLLTAVIVANNFLCLATKQIKNCFFNFCYGCALMITVFTMNTSAIFTDIKNYFDPQHPWNQWITFTNQNFASLKLFYFVLYSPPGYLFPFYTQSSVVSPWLNPWFMPYIMNSQNINETCKRHLTRDLLFFCQLFINSINTSKPDVVLLYIPQFNIEESHKKYLDLFQQKNIAQILLNHGYHLTGYFNRVAIFKK